MSNFSRPYDAIVWWERHRIPFNGIVLLVAACSLGIIEGIGAQLVKPGEDLIEPLGLLAVAIVFVVGANVCYTLGWITELMWGGGDTARTETFRRVVYRRGLWFSGAVAAAPGILIPLAWFIFGVG